MGISLLSSHAPMKEIDPLSTNDNRLDQCGVVLCQGMNNCFNPSIWRNDF
jgi:hypothetical protein